MKLEAICILVSIVLQMGAVGVALRAVRSRGRVNLWALATPPMLAVLLLEADFLVGAEGGSLEIIPGNLSRGIVALIASALFMGARCSSAG